MDGAVVGSEGAIWFVGMSELSWWELASKTEAIIWEYCEFDSDEACSREGTGTGATSIMERTLEPADDGESKSLIWSVGTNFGGPTTKGATASPSRRFGGGSESGGISGVSAAAFRPGLRRFLRFPGELAFASSSSSSPKRPAG